MAAGFVSGFAARGFAASGFVAAGFAVGGFAAAFWSFGAAGWACASDTAPHITPLATKTVRICRTDMTESGSLIIVTGRWPEIAHRAREGWPENAFLGRRLPGLCNDTPRPCHEYETFSSRAFRPRRP